MKENKVITIDGPAGAGKSSVARLVGKRTGFLYVDSGALYRILTWQSLQENINPEDQAALAGLAGRLRVDFTTSDGEIVYAVAGQVPGGEIRSPEVNRRVSPVSKAPQVRKRVTTWLRQMRSLGNLVVEGRDIGSVVFPDSPARFYLDADPGERARRRHVEEQGKGLSQTPEEVLRSIMNRDRIDSSRREAPLCVPGGAMVIDTTPLTIDEVVSAVTGNLPEGFLDS